MAKKAKVRKSLPVVITPVGSNIADLRQNADLWIRICALIYDMTNIAKDKTCERRTLQTTDELYISAPYFTSDEVVMIKSATTATNATLEEELKAALGNFFQKRNASGDCRPCGPHDLAPLYLDVFGISKAEIQNEAFISRLRRSRLGQQPV